MWTVIAESMMSEVKAEVGVPEGRSVAEFLTAVEGLMASMAFYNNGKSSGDLVNLETTVVGFRDVYEELVKLMLRYGVNPDRVFGDEFSLESAMASRIWEDLEVENLGQ